MNCYKNSRKWSGPTTRGGLPKYCSFFVVDQPKEKQNSKEIADDDQPLEPAAAKRPKRA